MRNLNGLKLDGATTMCHCWTLTRRDGQKFGFTDHDQILTFEGLSYAPSSGLTMSDCDHQSGFATTGAEISGALMSATLTESDIAAGLYDQAVIDCWLVDWRDASKRFLLDTGTIGEIRRTGESFTAETRSLASALDVPLGRSFETICPLTLGEAACGVKTNSVDLCASVQLQALQDDKFLTCSGSGFASAWFKGGALFCGPDRIGIILDHVERAQLCYLTLTDALSKPIPIGMSLRLEPGCDKALGTCRDKFGNALRFGGFPHMPVAELLLAPVREGSMVMDGGSFFR